MADSILIDPLGRRVVLHDHTWYGHVIVGHPEVRDARLLVERAVRQPLEIRLSLSDPRCRMYYGHGPRPTVKIVGGSEHRRRLREDRPSGQVIRGRVHRMVTTDTLEGMIGDALWFHYDVGNDVLYLRLTAERGTPTVGEETPDGLILVRREDDDRVVGLTVVSWWKRFGSGPLPDSIREFERQLEPWAAKLAA